MFSVAHPSWSILVLLLIHGVCQPGSWQGDIAVQNANHIFNAVHSSLRQWGSSYHHNGFSFFMATVPTGTQLYHGSPWLAEPVTGTEWLAFEPEHAMLFTTLLLPPNDRVSNRSEQIAEKDWYEEAYGNYVGYLQRFQSTFLRNHRAVADQIPLQTQDQNKGSKQLTGWLHTYETTHDLHLLYVDGMSAAKSSNGTLDSQDYILLNETDEHPVWWDLVRAERLCKIAEDEYSDRVDGVLRMEGGFEIILCKFERHLKTVRITRTMSRATDEFSQDHRGSVFSYFQAVASRYHGIGKERVRLNYDAFVTAYNYPINFSSGLKGLPRLDNVPFASLLPIREDIRRLVMSSNAFDQSRDWQVTADMIVTRYSTRLRHLITAPSPANETLIEVERLLEPFIDYQLRNASLEAIRCRDQFLPHPPFTQPSLVARAVTEVSRRICSTLVDILFDEDDGTLVQKLHDLVDYLDWSTWKECKGCGDDEICFIPIWPLGTFPDRESPSCTSAVDLFKKRGYWGTLPWND